MTLLEFAKAIVKAAEEDSSTTEVGLLSDAQIKGGCIHLDNDGEVGVCDFTNAHYNYAEIEFYSYSTTIYTDI